MSLSFNRLDLRVETFAVRVRGTRRRDRERQIATPGIDRAEQEINLSDRYAVTMTKWLERALRRRPERIVTVDAIWVDRAEVGDDFLSARFSLQARVRCVLPPEGILEGVTHYQLGDQSNVLSVVG